MRESLSRLTLCCLVVVLVGVDIDLPAVPVPKQSGNPFADRDALEKYIHDVTEICDQAVEEISLHVSQEQAEALRRQHYDWKVSRDTQCASPEKLSENELAELECIAARAETWYIELEARAENVVPPPSTLPPPPE